MAPRWLYAALPLVLATLAVAATPAETNPGLSLPHETNPPLAIPLKKHQKSRLGSLAPHAFQRRQASNNSGTLAGPNVQAGNTNGTCATINRRREWRTLSRNEKITYIQAVKCLAQRPSPLMRTPMNRLYDDFTYVHAQLVDQIHYTASFFPWHRWFMHVYHQHLIQDCGYQGPLPFWAWEQDYQNPIAAPVFDPDRQSGLGTNGRGRSGLTGREVTDGAFANWRVFYPQSHRLERRFGQPSRGGGMDPGYYGSNYISPRAMQETYNKTSYAQFHPWVEGTNTEFTWNTPQFRIGQHGVIHVIIGGDMNRLDLAPNDPLFFLHHSNVDRVYSKWQDLDPANRVKPTRTAYSGPRDPSVENDNTATVNDRLRFLGLGVPDPTVAQALDTRAWPLCYEYAS